MATSEQLERKAEFTRAQIADSLAELRDRMTPGQVMDETLDYFRDGRAGQFVRNLRQQVVDNPIPVALIGAGLGWLMLGNRTPRSESVLRSAAQMRTNKYETAGAGSSADRAARETSAWAKDTASSIGETSRDAGFKLKGAARDAGAAVSGAAASIGDTASSLYESAGEAYDIAADRARGAGRSASTLGANAVDSSRNLMAYLRDEPLVLAGIGLALGAVLGTALQITETEKQLMGKTSDAVKDGVGEAAEQTWEKGKAMANEAADQIWEEAKGGAQDQEQRQPIASGNGARSEHSEAAVHSATSEKSWTDTQPSLVPDSERPPEGTSGERKIIPGE
jgi:Protein of unknown function (DUF3618)